MGTSLSVGYQMKILYIFRSIAVWGGIERVLVDKMNSLASMYGYQIFMLTTDQGTHPVPYPLGKEVYLEDLNIQFHHQYRYSGIKRLMVARRLACLFEQRLLDHLKVIKPDVIICTTANYVDINILVKIKGEIPLVIESHSICSQTLNQKRFRKKYANLMFRRGLAKSDVLISLTEGDAADWRRIHSNVKVIPDIVHLNKGRKSSYNHKRVIWVGRFDYQKRPIEIIKIWEKVYPQFPDWHLDIYGEGEQWQELEDTVTSTNMNIHIHHPTDCIFEVYRRSSILVSTSLFEPFGLVIPEAMSCGLPVVAYDCPYGPSTMISDGNNGFLVDNNNRSLFAVKLSLLMSDMSLRQKMGQVASCSVHQFSAERIMPMWKELFENFF